MDEIRDVLELEKNDVPDYTTLNKSFARFKMRVWRALLRVKVVLADREAIHQEWEQAPDQGLREMTDRSDRLV